MSMALSLVRLLASTRSCSHSDCAVRGRRRRHDDGLSETGITGLLALRSRHGLPGIDNRAMLGVRWKKLQVATTTYCPIGLYVLAANEVPQLIDEVQ